MNTRSLALASLLILGSAGGIASSPPVEARTYVDVDVDVAPPPPRYEAVVVRPGYVWTPGYWRWNPAYHRHVWVAGVYVAERPGWHWRAHRWDRDDGGHWRFHEGGWDRD